MIGRTKNIPFLGRQKELSLIRERSLTDTAQLTVVYGRRRIGKTRLIEEAARRGRLIVFDGLEGQSTRVQQQSFLKQLAKVAGRHDYRWIHPSSWTDILILLSEYLKKRRAVVLLDEFQWMAAERTQLVSSFKYVWDRYFQKKNRAHFILCGSVSSFLVKKVIRSKALYGRVGLELCLRPLAIDEVKDLFLPQRSCRELVELYLCMGGVPQYLQMVDPSRSADANIASLCFTPHGYLVHDFERIFTSHFAKNKHYKALLAALSKAKWLTREQLQERCRLQSGGRTSAYLEDLELAGFIEAYTPLHKKLAERLRRYRIADPYLLFYFRFIAPVLHRIIRQTTHSGLQTFISSQQYAIWKGLAFEFFCYQHHERIADRLGFGAVRYECGSWFTRHDLQSGAQIDMLFSRADRVFTLCEVKFNEKPIGKEIIQDVEKKIEAFPNPRRWTIEKVLITASPPTKDLVKEGYFHRILTLEDLIQ